MYSLNGDESVNIISSNYCYHVCIPYQFNAVFFHFKVKRILEKLYEARAPSYQHQFEIPAYGGRFKYLLSKDSFILVILSWFSCNRPNAEDRRLM